MKLKHPGYNDIEVPSDLSGSLAWLQGKGRLSNYYRLKELYRIECRALELSHYSKVKLSTASETTKALLPQLNYPLTTELGSESDIWDVHVPGDTITGVSLVELTCDTSFFEDGG